MKKTIKVIYLYSQGIDPNFPSEGTDDYWISGHTGMLAFQFVKFEKKIKFESWRIDLNAKNDKSFEVFNILCRVFRGVKVPILGLVSLKIILSLYKENKLNDIIVHLGSISSIYFWFIVFLLPQINFVASQFGDRPYVIINSNNSIKFRIKRHLQNAFLLRMCNIFLASKLLVDSLVNIGIQKEKLSFPEIGVDPYIFKKTSKNEARDRLKIPKDKYIILYIGRFNIGKGIDKIIEFLEEISERGIKKYLLITIGGRAEDYYWDKIQKMENIIQYGFVPHHELPIYHSCSDVLVRLDFDDFGPLSVGTNIIEALSCGLPVISTTLKHFGLTNLEEYGVLPAKEEKLIDILEKYFTDNINNINTRSKVLEYYSWEKMTNIYCTVYKQIFK